MLVETYNSEISDHALIYGLINKPTSQTKAKIIKFRSTKQFIESDYMDNLKQAPWHVGEIYDDTDDQTEFYSSMMTSILDEHMPLKKMKVFRHDTPYMTDEWKRAIRAKRKVFKRYQRNKNLENWESLRILRNNCIRLRRKAIHEY